MLFEAVKNLSFKKKALPKKQYTLPIKKDGERERRRRRIG